MASRDTAQGVEVCWCRAEVVYATGGGDVVSSARAHGFGVHAEGSRVVLGSTASVGGIVVLHYAMVQRGVVVGHGAVMNHGTTSA
jgi:hypothetical protein